MRNFRKYAALLLLSVLIDKVANPAKVAVFWADELIKELNGKSTHDNSD
jgi:hypothetical protein